MGERKEIDNHTLIPRWCMKKAEYLLDNYKSLKEQEEKLVEELSKMRLYSHDDVIYLLSGVGSCPTDTERVQTSNISNPCEKAALNADDMQERLNREIGREEKKQLRWIRNNLEVVDVALKLMVGKNPELYHVADQLYVKGIQQKDIKDRAGSYYSRYQVGKMKKDIVTELAGHIILQERFKEISRESSQAASEPMWWECDD